MIEARSVRRTVALTTALVACAASPAAARVADAPIGGVAARPQSTVTHAQTTGVPPRVNAIGNPPRSRAVAVPVTVPSHDGGFDWLSAAIGVAAAVSLALLALAAWSARTARRVDSAIATPRAPRRQT
jgi:hypothetical protein